MDRSGYPATAITGNRERVAGLLLPSQVQEGRPILKHLVIEPTVDDAPAESPFLAKLGSRYSSLLCPFVDRLRFETQIRRDFLESEDLVIEIRISLPTIVHRTALPSPESGGLSKSWMTLAPAGSGASSFDWSSPSSNLFTE